MSNIKSFKDFYSFYLTQHANPWCRLLHIVGTFLAISWFFVCLILGKFFILPLFLLWGYGFSWIGHFVFERNKPAAFSQPIYSFICDLRMCFEFITFQRGLKD